jgi:hypothetical protein
MHVHMPFAVSCMQVAVYDLSIYMFFFLRLHDEKES